MKHPISIRINILTNFLIVIILIAGSLLGFQYYFSQQLAMSAVHKSFTQTAEKITQHIKARDTLTKNMLYLTEHYSDLTLSPADTRHINTIKRFSYNMQRSENIYAMYVGHPNGDLFEVINMNTSQNLYKHFNAPDNTRWAIIKVFNSPEGRIRQFDFLNNEFNLILRRSEKSDYLSYKRPWFIQASQSDNSIRTDSYTFSNLKQEGITFAKKIHNSKAVLAIDFTLAKLNAVFQQWAVEPGSNLLMFGSDGRVIAASNSQEPDEKLNTFLTQALKKNLSERIIIYEDKKTQSDKFVMLTPLSTEQNTDTYIGLTIDTNVMLNPYHKQNIYSVLIALIFLLFTIPLILYTTSKIVKPIKALMLQNQKIKDRQFKKVLPIDSNIIEMKDLSSSFVSMSQSIQTYQEAQEELMDSFIRLIADAIDTKSPYTGGHCQRVPEIAIMLAKKAHDYPLGIFKNFKLEGDDAWREFEIGAWLHDCGKITTPEYVVDKATKLETINNRIHEVRTRFEVIWRDIEIEYYQRINQGEEADSLSLWKHNAQQALQDDFTFVAETNIGSEFMSDDKKDRIHSIAQRTWIRHFNDRLGLSDTELLRYQNNEEHTVPTVEKLLSDKPEHLVERVNFNEEIYRQQGFKLEVPEYLYNYGELYNLCIAKGTLTDEERFKIQEHVIMTIKMLNTLPFPEQMQKVPEYAGTHHETMIATGYPCKLSREELSIPARIMAIADIFEALTASDRPYKKGKTLSQAIHIMNFMKKDQHIDSDIFELFLTSGIYKDYAQKYLNPEQIDNVDIDKYIT